MDQPGSDTRTSDESQNASGSESHKEKNNDDQEQQNKSGIITAAGNKFYVLQTGNTLNSHIKIIHHLKNQRPDLEEVTSLEKCDFILVFCPVVSRAGTDIEAAEKKLEDISGIKPAFLVVLHHAFDPECFVPESMRAVTRKNTITVDCLFHEDYGLLQCHKNDQSLTRMTNIIKPQQSEIKIEVEKDQPGSDTRTLDESQNASGSESHKEKNNDDQEQQNKSAIITAAGNTFYVLQTGNTLNSHIKIIHHLKNQRPDLEEVKSVVECDFILVFCPVVSRAGTDIEAAEKKLEDISAAKPVFLVVLHHTFDPECVVPESKRAVTRKNTITVDCLFHEDYGLLQCNKNDQSLTRMTDIIKPQVSHLICLSAASWASVYSLFSWIPRWGGFPSSLWDSFFGNTLNEDKQKVGMNSGDVLKTNEDEVPVLRLMMLDREGNLAAAFTAKSTAIRQNESTLLEIGGRKVSLVDIPNWFSSELFPEKQREDMKCHFHQSYPGPHAFLLVIPVKHSENNAVITQDELKVSLLKMEEIFGESCYGNTVIIFTVSDEDQKNCIKKCIQSGDQEVQKLIEKCGNRFHCLIITEIGAVSQVSELLETIEKMVEGDREKFYSSEIYLYTVACIEEIETIEKLKKKGKLGKELAEVIKLGQKGDQNNTRQEENSGIRIQEVCEEEINMEAERKEMKNTLHEIWKSIWTYSMKVQEYFSMKVGIYKNKIWEMKSQLQEKDKLIKDMKKQLEEKDNQLKKKDKQIEDIKKQLMEKDNELKKEDKQIEDMGAQFEEKDAEDWRIVDKKA